MAGPMLQLIVFNITNGLIIGAFYALMAIGLSLILNLSGVINFAHGGFLVMALSRLHADAVARFLGRPHRCAVPHRADRLCRRAPAHSPPVRPRSALQLAADPRLAFVIEDGTRQIWGAQGLPVSIPAALSSPLSNQFFFITGYRMFMVATVATVVGLLFVLLRYTRIGVRIRAGTLDLDTVAALGVNVRALRSLNFAVGIFLAGLAGVLAGGQLGLEPTMGDGLLMPSFIAIIVGGVGSLTGTLSGGLLIGVASGLTAVIFPSASEAVIYVMMAIVLLARPRGLLGEEGMFT